MQPSSVWRNHSQKIWSADFQSKRETIKISFPGFLIMYSGIKHITKKSVPTSLSILPQGGGPATPECKFPSTGGGDRIAVGRVSPPSPTSSVLPLGGGPATPECKFPSTGGGFPGGHPRTPAHSVHRFPSQAGASSP